MQEMDMLHLRHVPGPLSLNTFVFVQSTTVLSAMRAKSSASDVTCTRPRTSSTLPDLSERAQAERPVSDLNDLFASESDDQTGSSVRPEAVDSSPTCLDRGGFCFGCSDCTQGSVGLRRMH
ncbi:hypothetical protein EG68_01146 [Paragonimus skrjabini miyazakii]|uniref:Uncharacterized protein n=1 Tax=Paragonimus skrjabini miyazakii TaxID=59628 RepID=A0A8S9Z7P1_9TREM|nr:hypothetical protein EG68_01146 [Paragonimus skrjabini miyazakii]